MDFRKFFNKSTFVKIAEGCSNWDYYLMQFEDGSPSVTSIAKDGSGAKDSHFGDLKYFERYLKRKNASEIELTDFGKALLVN